MKWSIGRSAYQNQYLIKTFGCPRRVSALDDDFHLTLFWQHTTFGARSDQIPYTCTPVPQRDCLGFGVLQVQLQKSFSHIDVPYWDSGEKEKGKCFLFFTLSLSLAQGLLCLCTLLSLCENGQIEVGFLPRG